MFKKCLLSVMAVIGFTACTMAAPMELVFSVGAGNTVELPLYGTVACTVDWGDGSSPDTVSAAGKLAHVFSSAVVCTTSISGTVTTFGNVIGWTGSNKMTSVITFGDIGLTSLPGAFRNADNLASVPAVLPPAVTGLSYAFAYINQASIANLDLWDMGSVTDISYLFFYAQNFNQDIGGWDVGAAQDMRGVFYAAQSFNQDIGGWDVSAATDMYKMFYYASAFNKSLNGWDVSSVTDMSQMFESATSFNNTIGSWNVGAVTDMSSMFHSAAAFNQDISTWNVSAVTDMSRMFYAASKFDQDLSSWNVGAVTDMCSTFCEASVFNADLSGWDVGSVQNMGSMFCNADSFSAAIGGWDVSAVTDMSYMFYNADAFNADISSWDVSSVTDMGYMFCQNNSFNQDISGWNTGAVVNMKGTFMSAMAFGQDIGSWNVSAVTDMSYMFYNADGFNHDIGGWDVSSVTNLRYMFCYNGTFDQNLGNWDVSGVTDMTSMFNGVTLSTANYDSLLIGWEANGVQSGVSFNGGNSMYSDASAAARQSLAETSGWTISDGGLVPVELSSFTASPSASGALLTWTTVSEQHNLGFHVLRSTSESGPFERVNTSLIPGNGTTNIMQEYQYLDETAESGSYYYILEQMDSNGTTTRTEPVYVEITLTGMDDYLPVSALKGLVPGRSYNLHGGTAVGQGVGIIFVQDENGKLVKLLQLR